MSALEQRQAAAAEAAGRVGVDVSAGGDFASEDLDVIREFNRELSAVREAVKAAAPTGTRVETVADMRQALEAIETIASDGELLDAASLLSEMPEDQPGSASVVACKRAAKALLEPGSLEEPPQRQVAEGLRALVRLRRGLVDDDRAELEALASSSLPSDCLPVVGLAVGGILDLGITDARAPDDGAAAPAEEVAADAAEAVDEGKEPVPVAEEEEVVPDAEPAAKPEPVVEPEEEEVGDPIEPATGGEEPSPQEVKDAIRIVIQQRRFGLAYWLVEASAGPAVLARALKGMAYASAMRNPVGESAGRLRELIAKEFSPEELAGERSAQVLTLVAGLRATLLAPYSGAGALLDGVAPSFSEPADLGKLIETVVVAGRRGVSATDMTSQVQSLAMTEDSLGAIQNRARELLKLSTIKYQRASNVWRKWTESDGLIGSILGEVIANRAENAERVEQRIFGLRGAKELDRELDATDRMLKSAGRQQPIIAKARYKLIERAEEALNIAADWVEVTRQLKRKKQEQQSASWQHELLDEPRTIARDAREQVKEAWDNWREGGGILAAVAEGTQPMMEEIFALVIEGRSPEGSEQQVDEILGLDLLRVDGLDIDGSLRPARLLGKHDLRALIDSVEGQGWESAFDRRTAEGNFVVAARIVDVVRRDAPDRADEMERVRIERLEDERGHLKNHLDGAARDLGAARRLGQIPEEEALALSNELTALSLDEDQEDLRGIGRSIDEFRGGLDDAKQTGLEAARSEYESKLESDARLEPYRDRFRELLDRGEISTLEELVLAAERGLPPPLGPTDLFKQLTSFFPTVVDELGARPQLAADVIASEIADGGALGPLDFAGLEEEEVDAVQAAVASWKRLAQRDLRSFGGDVASVLEFLGLTLDQDVELKRGPKTGRRMSVEALCTPLGKALVPSFGSAASGRYRLLLVWEAMTDDTLVAALSQEPGENPIVVLCLGPPFKGTTRRGIADQLRHDRFGRAAALIDEPAFMYLASRGGRSLSTTMRISLPFTAVNPYTPFVAGSVPVEMFYGRHRELEEIIDPNGTSFIYGGRRLGKSALLRAAERRVNDEGGGHQALYIDLKGKGVGEWRAAGEIVDVIIGALVEEKVLMPTATKAESSNFESLREQVLAWLEIDSGRRLLLLLDECDSFLNADADEGFASVSQLKALMEESNRKFKPVLAGLHQVGRFQRMPNQPLAHLGTPTPIGPLTAQHAHNLIVKPLEALGYEFTPRDLAERILTATNYQPSLIQLFCSELIKHMLGRARGPGTPPYSISSEDVEEVNRTPHVMEEMRGRFELTINLDPRYRVIAYGVAFEAREGKISAGLAPPEIRAICDEYWPAGFAETGRDEFRALLEEMESLGVLLAKEGKFLMRSPNVLRMLGTGEEIEEKLYAASDELDLPSGFEAATFRGEIDGDGYKRRPLTHQQEAGLLERRPQVRVVLGSRALGIDDVVPCLEEIYKGEGQSFSFVDLTGQGSRRMIGRFRKPVRKKHRVVSFRIASGPGDAMDLIRKVEEQIFANDDASTAIFVVDIESLPTWRALLAPAVEGERVDDAASRLDIVELRRWTASGLRSWAQSQEVDLPFHASNVLAELMRATGGWPSLVQKVVKAYAPKRNWPKALENLRSGLDSREGAVELCESVGLTDDFELEAVWRTLVEYNEPVERQAVENLVDADVEETAAALDILRSMQLLELDAGGRYVVEATAARAWQARRGMLVDAEP